MADTLLGGIIINEILVDPNGANNFDTDGSGAANATDEFIELFNSSGAAIDISGLQLWDAGIGNWFTFPPGSVLASGAHAMVMTGVQAGGSLPTGAPGDLFFDAGRGSALINNGGDNVTVYDPGSNEFIQATFNGDALDDPTAGAMAIPGFRPLRHAQARARILAATMTGFRSSAGRMGRTPLSMMRRRHRGRRTSVSPTARCLPGQAGRWRSRRWGRVICW